MDSMLKPKLSDDSQDIPVVARDPVRFALADEAPSDPIRDLMRGGSLEPQIHAESDFSAGAAVPPVDTTFRPTAVNDVLAPRHRSVGRRALRAVTALLLTACISGAKTPSERSSPSGTARASTFKARCRISGTGPAPIQTERNPGHSSGSTSRSGTSTNENRIG